MIEALRKVIKRMHYPLEVMLTCVRWYVAYPRFMAKRMGAKTIEVKASHLSLISHPDEITHLILEAAGKPS
jgi:bacterioferritin (cytochrome b1)